MCGEVKRLCEAHVIPESFFRKIKGDQATLLLIPSDKDAYQGKRPKGSWDSNILCAECDNWLNEKYDRFGSQVFLDHAGITFVFDTQLEEWFPRFDDPDVDRIRRFALSVLWRAHHSQIDEYRSFSLGALVDRVRELVVDQRPFEPMEFQTFIACYDVNIVILNPVHVDLEGQRYWEVGLGSWQIMVKMNPGPVHDTFGQAVLTSGRPNFALPIPLNGSKHLERIREMLIQNQEKKSMNRR